MRQLFTFLLFENEKKMNLLLFKYYIMFSRTLNEIKKYSTRQQVAFSVNIPPGICKIFSVGSK